MRIAHIGTFDVENYGDLLFPLIVERQLKDLATEIVHFSPVGGDPPWDDCVSSTSINAVFEEQEQFDAVIIGGGQLINATTRPVKAYRNSEFLRRTAYPGLWLGAAYLGVRHGVPII